MFTYFAAAVVSFVGVFFKAFQQLNVVHHKILWVVPVSYVMAACEVFLIWQVAVAQSLWLLFPIGTGAGLGCVLSMTLHKHLRKLYDETQVHGREAASA